MFSTTILKCFLGVDDVSQKIRDQKFPIFIVNLLTKLSSVASSFPVLLLGKYAYKLGLTKQLRNINNMTRLYREVYYNFIKQRKNAILSKIKEKSIEKYSDILEALVVHHTKYNDSTAIPDTMTDKELFEELSNFLIAGTDITSALTQIMLYFITENRNVQIKLRQTVEKIIKSKQEITYENLKKLEYLDWIQNETLRMGTPVSGVFLRKSQQDHYLNKVPISKGTTFAISPYANQYNPKYFKDPKYSLPAFAVFGFSGGPRNCIGKHLALLQNKIAIILFLKRYKKIKLPLQKRVMMRRFLYEPLPAKFTFVKSNNFKQSKLQQIRFDR